MNTIRFIIFCFFILLFACNNNSDQEILLVEGKECFRGALLGSRYNSMEELKKDISINYSSQGIDRVIINHSCKGFTVQSIIEEGISEDDFKTASKGGLTEKISFLIACPYGVFHRKELTNFFIMSRRKGQYFKEGDVSFFDIALRMMSNIDKQSADTIYTRDFTEKGYMNTFNHIFSQAMATSIYSEKLADFLADVHERAHLPEIVTGDFSLDQLRDLEEGALDNYVDIINNEWGQEIGKFLKDKYGICKHTDWTAQLLAHYLNDVQSYLCWSLGIFMSPFSAEDKIVIRFAEKLNLLTKNPGKYK